MKAGEVRVWLIALPARIAAVDRSRLESWLSPEERERAGRFADGEGAGRWMAGRLALRLALARELEADPRSLRFRTDAAGRPALEPAGRDFNFSRTANLCACAVSLTDGMRVGVDVERLVWHPDLEGVIAEFFTAEEAAFLRSCPAEVRPAQFFALWTLKEAALKARGRGLRDSLGSVPVEFPIAGEARLGQREGAVATCGESGTVGPLHLLAVAVEGRAAMQIQRRRATLDVSEGALLIDAASSDGTREAE